MFIFARKDKEEPRATPLGTPEMDIVLASTLDLSSKMYEYDIENMSLSIVAMPCKNLKKINNTREPIKGIRNNVNDINKIIPKVEKTVFLWNLKNLPNILPKGIPAK